ncbi:uncharacterized protein C16orf78 homolog [Suncus etruscus]|uniref:uncharacterized protein C16orf78 homolog n=1 Tax=Suncus etruscus TaxID=109475 RepID=UPI002110DE79|nr:uncharacterized protein C16orf78 homolog [Suncus etruscus]
MTEDLENLKDKMPTERKSVWRSAEERRMSDLTRVLEWMERRQGKKKQEQGQPTQRKASVKGTKKDMEPAAQAQKSYVDMKKRRISSIGGSSNAKEPARKSELDIKDVIALESTPRPFRQQSVVEPVLQDILFSQRRSTLFKDWTGKTSEALYERRLKSIIEKAPEVKSEAVKMLKPEEVLSCRYLRLSKNNVRTLLKLCKDAGMNVDIHPHMVEGEIDGQKVFGHKPSNVV